jgi:hypothetical protein
LGQSVLTSELVASLALPDYNNNNSFSLHYILIKLKSKIFLGLAACHLVEVTAGNGTALSEEKVIVLSVNLCRGALSIHLTKYLAVQYIYVHVNG